jgi:signal transduction histidine kinase
VIDFSTKPVVLIENNLKSLRKFFITFMGIVIFIIITLLIFIIYDIKRENQLRKLLKKVKELNASLKLKVKEEVAKSREKDKQLILQSRMAMMGELLSMIAHQWRQPLNVIAGIISNVELDLKLQNKVDLKELEECINRIKENVMYLSQTIDDFRNFYRNDSKKEKVNVDQLIKEVVNLILPSLKYKGIKIILDLKCEKEVYLLKNEFKQVLLNLIKNAQDVLVERKVENPYILIRSFHENKKCIIEVKDNAGGIDEKIKDEIFKPYFTTKDEKNGTGLGLYMSKMIIENRLNGKILAYNDSEGAVFKIELE